MEKNRIKRAIPVLILILGIAAVSTASTMIRLAQNEISSLAIAAWRLTIASSLLIPFGLYQCREEWSKLNTRDWILAVLSGLMLAVHFYTWIVSLELTSVAASVALVSTNPIFVAIISHFYLKDRLQQYTTIGLVIAVIGSTVIGLHDLQQGNHRIVGDLLAIIGALSVAIYMLIGRKLREKLSLLGYILPVYSTAAILLMSFALMKQEKLIGYSSSIWVILVLLAIFPQIIGHSSLNWALGHVPATLVALSVLAEPIGSTLLAWMTLGEKPSLTAVIGAFFILGGIFVATRKGKSNI